VVGRVDAIGEDSSRFTVGERVGVGWIHHSSGDRDENLSTQFQATGCDVDGGYAEYMTVPEDYAVAIPEGLSNREAAPLMCAGAIGYRALKLTGIKDGQVLGLMGFGSSAHLVIQTARHLYPSSPIYVFDRSESVREFATSLGAQWTGGVDAAPPHPVQAIIDTTPVWRPVVESMKKLAAGGRLVINAIRKSDSDKEALLDLSYHDHLWMEREIKSVANLTHFDIAEFLPIAAQIPLKPTVTPFPLEAANEALQAVNSGGVRGSNVLIVE
jgi:propanol-preferring alcohol dehydrogenase